MFSNYFVICESDDLCIQLSITVITFWIYYLTIKFYTIKNYNCILFSYARLDNDDND